MEINKDDINKIIDERVSAIVIELTKKLIEEYKEIDEINTDYTNKIINYSMDSLITKINKLYVDNTINVMFIKAVLYSHGLTTEECYNNYKEEWHRLNPSASYRDTNKDVTAKYSKISDTIDAVEICNHDKVYDKNILTSYPPQQKWKCKVCGETGIDIMKGI